MSDSSQGGETGADERLTRVRFTNLDRIMYPGIPATKKDVIGYYIRIAPLILPFLKDRLLTLKRFPSGIAGESFYEKDAPAVRPDFVPVFTRHSETAGREVHFIVCNNLDTLLWVANLAALELHVTLSTAQSYDSPDLLLFDIDPEPPLTFADVCSVALVVKDHLAGAGVRPYVKTSGKKGLHIVVPLLPGLRFSEVRDFCHAAGKEIAGKVPFVVSEFAHSQDPGTVFIDYLQNAHGKTMAAPYSLRATPGATVSAPLEWSEVERMVRPEDFNIGTMLTRNREPWRGIFEDRQKIT